MSFNQGSNNLRRIANQRLSAMSNYETVNTTKGPSNTRGSQSFMINQHSGGS